MGSPKKSLWPYQGRRSRRTHRPLPTSQTTTKLHENWHSQQPLWDNLIEIVLNPQRDAAVCTCCNGFWYPQRLSSHETALLSQLCWKAKKWWILGYSLTIELNDSIFTHLNILSGNVFGFGPNIEIPTAGVFHSSETQDSLVRIHRLSFRFRNAKHLVVKALVLSRLDQSISEILRLHFEQHNVQYNEVTSLVFVAKMLMCLIKCPCGKTPNPRPTSRPKMKPPKRAYLRMPNTNPTRKECKKTSFQKLKL